MTTSTHLEIDVIPAPGKKGVPPPLAPYCKTAAEPIKVKKLAIIYNPVGGKKRGKKTIETVVVPTLKEAGIEAVVHPTERAGHAAELARTISLDGVDGVVALGGDGTLSDVLSGFLARDDGAAASVPLGFLPGGTGNTFLHDALGVRPSGAAAMRSALEAIIGGRTRRIDAAKCECTSLDGSSKVSKYSLNIVTCGLGVDANFAAEKRRWMGAARYDYSILREILKIPCKKPLVCTLALDGGAPIEIDLMVLTMMNNKRTGAGLRLSPAAQLDDGRLDVMYNCRKISRIAQALRIDGLIKKGGAHIYCNDVAYTTAAKTIEVDGPTPLKLMNDGDQLGLTPLKMSVMPGAFALFSPADPPPL